MGGRGGGGRKQSCPIRQCLLRELSLKTKKFMILKTVCETSQRSAKKNETLEILPRSVLQAHCKCSLQMLYQRYKRFIEYGLVWTGP